MCTHSSPRVRNLAIESEESPSSDAQARPALRKNVASGIARVNPFQIRWRDQKKMQRTDLHLREGSASKDAGRQTTFAPRSCGLHARSPILSGRCRINPEEVPMTFLRSAVRMARLASSIVVAATAIAAAASSVPADHAAIQEAYGRLPITFERNMGQAPAPYEYVSHGSRFQLLLGRDSAVLYLAPSSAGRSEKATMKAGPVTLRFVGARDGALRGEEEAEGKTNYLWGP